MREKGYARTTARDIVAASGTNLASIGYHYGSTHALMNAAVLQAMEEFGAEISRVMAESTEGTTLDIFERFWSHVIDSFQASAQVWMATVEAFTVASRDPGLRASIADGLEDGRMLWARYLYGDDANPDILHAVGSLHQALVSGIMVQWLIDPERAPRAAELAGALRAVAARIGDEPHGGDLPHPPINPK